MSQVILVRFGMDLLGWFCGSSLFSGLGATLVKGSIETSQLITQIAKDVGSTDLDKRLISCLQEDHVLFVNVPKECISQHQVNSLPVPCNHTLLVEVDVVTLHKVLVGPSIYWIKVSNGTYCIMGGIFSALKPCPPPPIVYPPPMRSI